MKTLIDDMAAVLREAVTAEERSGGLPPWLPKARAALAALDGLEPRTALSYVPKGTPKMEAGA